MSETTAPRFAAAVASPKVVRHELTRRERFFFGPFLKSLRFTFTRMFRKPMTRRYPEERMEVKPTLHGVPVLVMRDDGAPRCVACGLCEWACPVDCISIDPAETEDAIQRYPKVFDIDMGRCMYCGLCEEACPEEAIVMSDRVEISAFSREAILWHKQDLLVPVDRLPKRIDYIRGGYPRR